MFDANYFYCFVEPQFIVAKQCGSGDADGPAEWLPLQLVRGERHGADPAPRDRLRRGSAPLDETQVGAGSPAQSNLQAVSLEMSVDYLNAPIILRPTGHDHPRQVFTLSDPVVDIIGTWATK